MPDRDTLAEAREAFDLASETFAENYEAAKEDLRFGRLGEQWPAKMLQQRAAEGRPALTVNRMNAFIRQVVNDARLNRPSMKVRPVDSGADPETAEIVNGLIRNIEYTSDADVAYDTAVEHAVAGGFGFFRIGIDYATDDAFDMDLLIQRVSNPFLVCGDPHSTAADSSDWNSAFVIERMTKKRFAAQWKGADAVNWDGAYVELPTPWLEDDAVMVAEWWTRDRIERRIVKLSSGQVVDAEWLEGVDPDSGIPRAALLAAGGVTPVADRMARSWQTRQRILTGAEVLEDNPWAGRYIPIVPVYGDEVDVEGKRHFRSLIRDAKDPQRMFNFWRTAATELVALAPRVPFIGPVGSFKTDKNWATANRVSHPYLEYDVVGPNPPQRQPLDTGAAAGALQEALNASDDMKAAMGLYDASLGARSNETSGRAIMARQREGDVSTFHFQDNLNRAIRHGGRILIDLIPHVYSAARVVRVLGEDRGERAVPVNQPVNVAGDGGEPQIGPDGQPVTRIYSLTSGKYDLTVSSGPSFTSRREEAATQMMEFIRMYPAAAPIIGDLVAQNLDWPGADEIADRLRKLLPQAIAEGLPPEIATMIKKGQEIIATLKAENEQLKVENRLVKADRAAKNAVDAANAETKRYEAETDRMSAQNRITDQIVDLVRRLVDEEITRSVGPVAA